MSSRDVVRRELGWKLAQTAAFAWREFLSHNPPMIVATTMLPRAVLQSLFFVMLGRLVGGLEHAEYVLMGTPAITLPVMCTINITELVMTEKWAGTFWRIRRGRLHPILVFALRVWPYPVVGLAMSLVSLIAAGLLAGLGSSLIRVLPLVAIYALMAVTTSATGLACVALAMGKRADVVVANLMGYLIILASGAFLPPDRLGWAEPLSWVLPTSHGLAGVRAAAAGEPWGAQVALELAVGAGWALLAAAVLAVQLRRAHRSGHDDFA